MARRLRENKLGVEASQVNLKINPERKAVQGLSIGDNDLTQVAKALSGIAPQINKFLMQEHDKINEKYHLDAERRVNELEFDPETNELAENMIKDNNNPSFLKSMEHFRGLKLARYASADYAQRYAGLATNEAGDNALFPNQDDPEDAVPSAIREFAPEGASDTFMKAFNQGMAKTHHQGREYFLQQVGITAAKNKQEAGYFFLDDAQKDPQTGDYLPPEAAVEALMGSKQEFMKTHTEDEWYQQMLAQGAVRANQGDTEYIKFLSEMKSDLGLAFKDDPNHSAKLAQLADLAVSKATGDREEEAIRNVEDIRARSSNNDTTPLELSEALQTGEITKDEFVTFTGHAARSAITAQNKSKTSLAKNASAKSDGITKRDFLNDALNAYLDGNKSMVRYTEDKFYPKNKETGKSVTITNADFKAGLNSRMEFRLGQQMAIKNKKAVSPKDVATNTAKFVADMSEFIKDSGGKFPKWKDMFERTYADMLDSDAQMGQVDGETAAGLQIALTLRKVNPAIFNKFTTDDQRKLYDQVAAYSSVGLGELHELEQIKVIISKVANEEATISNSNADIGDVSLKDTRRGKQRLMDVGASELKANQILNSGLAASRGDNQTASEKIDEIVKRAEDSKVDLSDGSVIFKSPEQAMGFSTVASQYSKSDDTFDIGEALDVFRAKAEHLIADREPNQKVKIIQHPNNDQAYLLADEWDFPFHDASGAWIVTTDDATAPWIGIRKQREIALEEAEEGIFKREYDKAMADHKASNSLGTGVYDSTNIAHDKTREALEGYLDRPTKDLPEDVKGFIQGFKDAEEAEVEKAKEAAEAYAERLREINERLSLNEKGLVGYKLEAFGWDKK